MTALDPTLKAELDAALEWWSLAGVDSDFSEDATDWLATVEPEKPVEAPRAKPKSAPEPAPEPEVVRQNLLGESPPDSIDAFHKFWMEAPGLDAIGPRGRVPPRGSTGAELMVLVIDPEERDNDRLLSGPQGALLDRIVAAMGLAQDQLYLASALPRHTPMSDTMAQAAAGMDAVTLHHIKLAAPKRILAFGKNILPLLGHELTKDSSSLREINQNPQSIPLLVSEDLDSMMSVPRLKARFWRRWIEWSPD